LIFNILLVIGAKMSVEHFKTKIKAEKKYHFLRLLTTAVPIEPNFQRFKFVKLKPVVRLVRIYSYNITIVGPSFKQPNNLPIH
jgi:hypothetical protein